MSWSRSIIEFVNHLTPPASVPDGIDVLDPYKDSQTMDVVIEFYNKFYSDNNSRILLIGINPGRFGGGTTGIPFTDPIFLDEMCGIKNQLEKRHELSSKFIYHMIDSFGGTELFYKKFFISAVSPLGFTRNGKNLNYYDDKELQNSWESFFVECMNQQMDFGANSSIAYSLGQGKNIAYLNYLNEKHHFFKEIKALPHPRWIMQYRLKKLDEFTQMYVNELSSL